jgi:assimilatory nitrate reductase catalytic subunit
MSIEAAGMNAPCKFQPVRTTCPYCGVGCGVLAKPDGQGGTQIDGDPDHPANFGRLCSKGSALGETLSFEGRLLHPQVRCDDGELRQASWDEALNRVATGFQDIVAQHGPDAVAFYVSGQLLTEDYYVANKLMKGFIGSANIDTNSRLCMASAVAGHKRAFGTDTVPGCYEDLEEADLLVLVGSNAAWCHPVLFQRMVRNKVQRGARMVVIDPRRTPTADEADLVLQIAPGTDSVLFSGLLAYLADRDVLDRRFIGASTQGFSETLARARHIAPDVEAVARACSVSRDDVATLFDWFCATPKAVTLFSQGVNQSAQGTDKVNAIINCHLATGRIGRPGMGPFSLTGQPNAMGGREVGGLANQLAAHMGFEPDSIDRVRRFWNAPAMAQREGLKAVDLFDAISAGRIKALWVMATNPAVSLPRADAARAALSKLDLFVVSEVVASTDTSSARPHVLLPAAAWGEKDGTVTNSERRISRQRSFLEPPGEAKPDWWIVAQVGKRMGYAKAFDYRYPAEIFREHAALSAFENDGTRDFDLSRFCDIDPGAYESLAPVQWPPAARGGTDRLFADGRFFTPDGRARFVPVAPPEMSARPDQPHPFILNTGRVRDHWHTMTRTGRSPRLSAHIDEPFVAMHPDDAAGAGVAEGELATVASVHGSAVLRVRCSDAQRRGEVFAPIHWNGQTASHARVGALVHQVCDPISGQPDMKATAVAVSPARFAAYGFLLSAAAVTLPDGMWWARATIGGGQAVRFAVNAQASDWRAMARAMVGGDGAIVDFDDRIHQAYRAARIVGDRLESCVYVASQPDLLPGWDWLKQQIAEPHLEAVARKAVLAGRPPDGVRDCGPTVCACFGVGLKAISDLIESGAATSVDEVGARLKAGTNCGSCQPEIRKLIAATNGAKVLEAAS